MLAWQRFSQWQLTQKLWNRAPDTLSPERQRALERQLARSYAWSRPWRTPHCNIGRRSLTP